MSDIDFDELDKAVSSVLKKDEPTPTQTQAPAEVTASVAPPQASIEVTEPQPAPAVEASAAPTVDAPETVPATEVPVMSQSPAVKRSSNGRFMDMVHPSSDMKNATAVAPSKKPAFLAPLSADIAAPAASSEETPSTEEETTQSVPSLDTQASSSTEQPFVPNPWDVQSAPEPNVAPEAPQAEVTPETMPDEDESQPDVDVEQQPEEQAPEAPVKEAPVINEPTTEEPAATVVDESGTPFLNDTKVQKRPLNAFTGQEPADTEDSNNQDLQMPAVPSLPPELNAEMLAVDSTETTDENDDGGTKADEQVSVPDQPQAQATAIPEVSQPMFDTQEYHQPLTAAHKSKSRMWIIVALLVLLPIVGGAIGALVYFAGI